MQFEQSRHDTAKPDILNSSCSNRTGMQHFLIDRVTASQNEIGKIISNCLASFQPFLNFDRYLLKVLNKVKERTTKVVRDGTSVRQVSQSFDNIAKNFGTCTAGVTFNLYDSNIARTRLWRFPFYIRHTMRKLYKKSRLKFTLYHVDESIVC